MERPKKAIFGYFRPFLPFPYLKEMNMGPRTTQNASPSIPTGFVQVSVPKSSYSMKNRPIIGRKQPKMAFFGLSIPKRNKSGSKNYIESLNQYPHRFCTSFGSEILIFYNKQAHNQPKTAKYGIFQNGPSKIGLFWQKGAFQSKKS